VPLTAGDKLGPYEIVALLGEGGMGQVYRARDPRLAREVAIKVASAHFSERFDREARAVAALNHTNICHLYDVGPNYLVMELVEGETLRGPLAFDQAMPIVRQLIDGIEAAHEKNIVHRDLKPANIKITPEGVVKILDFGLAKTTRPEPESVSENSPTLTMGATAAGTILGTAAYMASEQARGKAADKRSDIWSFGVVLYELLTGRRPFGGETVVDTLGAVINKEPDWTTVPPRARKLLEWCLEKERKQRLASISDARRLVEATEPVPDVPAQPARGRSRLAWAAAGVFALAAVVVSTIHFREAPAAQPTVRFDVPLPGNSTGANFEISPDGRYLAMAAQEGNRTQLWLRALDSAEPRLIPGTDGVVYPFWSPDSAFIGFFADGKLKKVAVSGGSPQILCEANSGNGGAWNQTGELVVALSLRSGLYRVPAQGGVPAPLAKPDGIERYPFFLPDGRHFLFLRAGLSQEGTGIYVGSLEGTAPVRLLPDESSAQYAAGATPDRGYLTFRRGTTLMAQPFDARTRKLTGPMFPIAERVPFSTSITYGAFSVSARGTLVYRSGDAAGKSELVWIDRAGKRLGTLGKPGPMLGPALSPDEKRLGVAVVDPQTGKSDIWLLEIARGVTSRFTSGSQPIVAAVWSPDGNSMVYSSRAAAALQDFFEQPTNGAGGPQLLMQATGINGFPFDWSPDGKFVVYAQTVEKTKRDLWLLPMQGDHKPVPFLQTAANEDLPQFSPDGRWLAYVSDESGQDQVYLRAFPSGNAQIQISTAGGSFPRWRRDGRELFYIGADQN
jgi:Tol biopolymer transport system component/predicted Ser/Thr protein kinase